MLESVIAVAESAGRLIEEIRRSGFGVHQKGTEGPVTDADKAADTFLKERLLNLDACAWLSEETGDDQSRINSDRVWVVDPLDGTKEYVQGIPEYSIAIALVENRRPVLAVVHNPATKETIAAERGSRTQTQAAQVRTLEGNTMLASRSEMRGREFVTFAPEWDVEAIGSIEYKLALVACGRASVTLSRGPKWEWDVCAGALLVEMAGGLATDVFGQPLVFNQSFPKVKGILAGAPQAHARALIATLELGPSDRMREFADMVDNPPHRPPFPQDHDGC